MVLLGKLLFSLLLVTIVATGLSASELINLYVDCGSCDLDFYRTEIDFVNFVRDRAEADLHLLITDQTTGSGGEEFTLTLIGKKRFEGLSDTLTVTTLESDTDDEIRAAQLQVLRLGLVRFVARTSGAKCLEIAYSASADQVSSDASSTANKWRNWVFTISGSGYFNGQKSYKRYTLQGNLYAQRVTESLKTGVNFYADKTRDKFSTDDYCVVSESNGHGIGTHAIFSLTDHWSAAIQFDAYRSTYSNRDLSLITTTGIEYNIYPYSLSTHKQLRLQYTVSHAYNEYLNETIYDETSENLFRHELSATLEVTQPWGSAEVTAEFSHYLQWMKYNHLTGYAEVSLNVVGGLSIEIYGNASRVRDQLSLPKEGASFEEVLLQRRQLETSYSYYVSVGLSYTFGSIYNNIVNSRFGN